MNHPPEKKTSADARNFFGGGRFILVAVSLCALVATFLLVNLNLDLPDKIACFAAIIVLYLAFSAAIYRRQNQSAAAATAEIKDAPPISSGEIESRLFALEEANQFFGASLKPHDMFRLVASRVNELVPFAACLLYVADETETNLKIAFAEGANEQFFANVTHGKNLGLAGSAFLSRKIQIDSHLTLEKSILPENALRGLSSAIAVPLVHNAQVFGIFEVFADEKTKLTAESAKLLEAVGERIAPLFANSLTFERNLANALTDSLTNLPNERAFYLVLENQIAETQRNPQLRPLTLLTIDLSDFNEINSKFGHAAGDRVLAFAGETIKNQLRQMDFPAHAAADEFYVVLPTANKKTAEEIIERLASVFLAVPFNINGRDKIYLNLNFGAAAFGADGETAAELLKIANLRRRRSKDKDSDNVLWFPNEIAG